MCSTKSCTSIPLPHPDFVGNGPTFVYTSQRSESPISPNAPSSNIKRVSSFTHFTIDEEKQVEYFFASDARWAPCGVLQSYISSFLFHHTVTWWNPATSSLLAKYEHHYMYATSAHTTCSVYHHGYWRNSTCHILLTVLSIKNLPLLAFHSYLATCKQHRTSNTLQHRHKLLVVCITMGAEGAVLVMSFWRSFLSPSTSPSLPLPPVLWLSIPTRWYTWKMMMLLL